ncbi:ATP/GTP-binding protein [Rathayibacter tritici]|uniref:ATP/GTP-binding protein n=1 Tax=Rathayibacter tritici TaxID=33888 RepID=UPI001CA5B3C7|nr:ATP/GTP-binding protein [Rathayibacter tritici]
MTTTDNRPAATDSPTPQRRRDLRTDSAPATPREARRAVTLARKEQKRRSPATDGPNRAQLRATLARSGIRSKKQQLEAHEELSALTSTRAEPTPTAAAAPAMPVTATTPRPVNASAGAGAKAGDARKPRPVPRPGPRGWYGPGAGAHTLVQPPPTFRGSTFQVCGMYPFTVGTGTPMVGVPVGRHLISGATVMADPISWFQRAKLILNPSVFVLGKPGLGKSTIIRRMVTGLAAYGTIPLILGDVKPDYVDLIRKLGGQVIAIGRGRGHLNPLDPGEATSAITKLHAAAADADADGARILADPAAAGESEEAITLRNEARQCTERGRRMREFADEIAHDAFQRRVTMLSALMNIANGHPPTAVETAILSAAIRELDATLDRISTVADLLHIVQDGPDRVRRAAIDRGSFERYQEITYSLEVVLRSLAEGDAFGGIFSAATDEPMQRDRPVVYDISGIPPAATADRAAALLACWANGFGSVNIASALAEAGLEPRRHYFVVVDEMWSALRAGHGLVDRLDETTRLNRQEGIGVAMISHTMSDLDALDEQDRKKALGFVERAGMVIMGGLPKREMPMLSTVIPLTATEQANVSSWQDPPAWDSTTGEEAKPPGLGNFLIKVGGRPGIPLHVDLVPSEETVYDTNKKWKERSRVGIRTPTGEAA